MRQSWGIFGVAHIPESAEDVELIRELVPAAVQANCQAESAAGLSVVRIQD